MKKTKNKNIDFPFKLKEGQIKVPITADMLLCKRAWIQLRIERKNKDIANKDKIKLSEIINYVKKYKPYEEGWVKMAKIRQDLEQSLVKAGHNAEEFKLYALLRHEKVIRYEVQPQKEIVEKYEEVLKELIHE